MTACAGIAAKLCMPARKISINTEGRSLDNCYHEGITSKGVTLMTPDQTSYFNLVLSSTQAHQTNTALTEAAIFSSDLDSGLFIEKLEDLGFDCMTEEGVFYSCFQEELKLSIEYSPRLKCFRASTYGEAITPVKADDLAMPTY